MPSLSSEERQQLHDSLLEMLTDKYPFEHWKKVARSPGGAGFGRAEGQPYAGLGWPGSALQEEDGAIVPPGVFLPAAERFGLMPQLDRRVVEKSFELLARLPQQFLSLIHI